MATGTSALAAAISLHSPFSFSTWAMQAFGAEVDANRIGCPP